MDDQITNKDNNTTTTSAGKGIEDVLFEKGLINADQLSAIKFEHVNTGKSAESIIKERGYVVNEDFVKSFGEVYGIAYVNLQQQQIDPKVCKWQYRG